MTDRSTQHPRFSIERTFAFPPARVFAAFATVEAGYVSFLADEGPGRGRAAYPGGAWDRLVAVKRQYDPENLFRRNQNVPPG